LCRSPFERSPFDRALSGMLKRRTHSESCLVALNSSSAASEEPRSLQSTASIPEGSVAASEGSAQSGIDADLLSTMRFNDSAYAEGGDTQHVMQAGSIMMQLMRLLSPIPCVCHGCDECMAVL